MKAPVGVVHGRFQLLHNDHVRYIMAGKEKCEHLVIGICNPDRNLTKYSAANPHRSTEAENPFTYYTRYQMIKGTLLHMGLSASDFDIVPFPINFPELIFNYAPCDAKYYITIYDAWGMEKKEKLEALGCSVEILWKVDQSEKGISGSDVRKLMAYGKEWRQFVPEFVYDYVIANHLNKCVMK